MVATPEGARSGIYLRNSLRDLEARVRYRGYVTCRLYSTFSSRIF